MSGMQCCGAMPGSCFCGTTQDGLTIRVGKREPLWRLTDVQKVARCSCGGEIYETQKVVSYIGSRPTLYRCRQCRALFVRIGDSWVGPEKPLMLDFSRLDEAGRQPNPIP